MKFKQIKLNTIIVIFSLFFTSLSFCQTINYKRIVNAKIIDVITKDTLSSHSSDIEAVQQLYNLQIAGRSVVMLGAVYKVDIKNTDLPDPIPLIEIEIDTVIVNLRLDNERNKIRSYQDLTRIIPLRYILTDELGMIKYKFDTVLNWQNKYRFERTKKYAETNYKELEKPFQGISYELIEITKTSFKINTYFTSNHAISFYRDGVMIKEFLSGTAEYIENKGWLSSYGYWNLNPDTEYLFEIIGYPHNNEAKSSIIFNFKTPL